MPDHQDLTAMPLENEAAVGRIALWAAWVENAIGIVCGALVNNEFPVVGNVVTANMRAAAMADLAKNLLKEARAMPEQQRDQILAALVEGKAALEQRNRVLHASVGGSLFPEKTAFYRRKRDFQRNFWAGDPVTEHLGFEELDAIGKRLYDAANALLDCSDGINQVYVHWRGVALSSEDVAQATPEDH